MPTSHFGKALADVAAERVRQVSEEGWTPEQDAGHRKGEMAKAAACYADPGRPMSGVRACPVRWPWDASWWRPKTRRRDLVRAGALIVAEIERLDRLAELSA